MRDVKGQLLLEVLIALTILGIVAVAVVRVSTRSLLSSRVAGDRKEALDLAKQVLVNVEKEKNDDIAGFFTRTDLEEDCNTEVYMCQVTYDFQETSDKVSVEVLVTWEDNSVSLDKIFTKTRL